MPAHNPTRYNPFIFHNGAQAFSVQDLIRLSLEYPDEAAWHLAEGHFDAWLNYIQRSDLSIRAAAARDVPLPFLADAEGGRRYRLTRWLEQMAFTRRHSKTGLPYLLHFPNEKTLSRPYPLILFLHGVLERGDDLDRMKRYAILDVVTRDPDFPFFVAAPQCPAELSWSQLIPRLNSFLAELLERFPVDSQRIYLTGISMGGWGTWDFAAANPGRFAAIAPMCGGGDPVLAERLKKIPAWVFHGAQDDQVPVEASLEMVTALRQRGAEVKLTVYPDCGHDCWSRGYADPELYRWFLSRRKYARIEG